MFRLNHVFFRFCATRLSPRSKKSTRRDVHYSVRALSERMSVEVVELNIQPDHVHLLALIPPKIKISDYLGTIKGRTATRIFAKHRHLKEKPYWGNKLGDVCISCWLFCQYGLPSFGDSIFWAVD